ncbi:MAG: type IV pilin N-terminal domain-containing protein [Methanimicrococcus sp.]|nr:type IV pilin N-terminal domain-containing protein [Methanimicrococcus sp.]
MKKLAKNNFLTDERGISPVIGVLLLLAITVVMAGYLATEVLSYEFTAPSQPVSLNARVETVVVGTSNYSVIRLEHFGGAPLQMSQVRILFNQKEVDLSSSKETFNIGESLAIGSIGADKTAVFSYPISQSTKKPSQNILKTGESAELVVIDSSNNQILYKKIITG